MVLSSHMDDTTTVADNGTAPKPPSRYAERRDSGRLALTVEFDRKTYRRLCAAREGEERSAAAIVRAATRQYLDRHGIADPEPDTKTT